MLKQYLYFIQGSSDFIVSMVVSNIINIRAIVFVLEIKVAKGLMQGIRIKKILYSYSFIVSSSLKLLKDKICS